MMTSRSRGRNTINRYASPNSPIHQRGVGNPAMRGGSQMASHPPTINIVDSSGHPHQRMPHHNTYHENVNNYYDSGYNTSEPTRSFGAGSPARYAGGHSNEGRVANSSLPTSPCNTRNTRPLGSSRGEPISSSTTNLPAGGGAGAFYWAAKVLIQVDIR